MIYPKEEFTGRSGRIYTIRSPEKDESEQMLAYLLTTAEETEYGLSYPEELTLTVADEEAFITRCAEGSGSVMISAFDGDRLVGNASLFGVMDRKKALHRAEFGMAILKSHWGEGLGRKLLTGLVACARQAGYKQLELEVAACNERAVNLYKSLGFTVYGERPRSLRLKNGEYLDEYLMLLELN